LITSAHDLCRLLGIEVPILQAPMTFIANADLAAAVSNAGGLGVIETASPGGRADLQRVRTLTDKPVGANVALAMMRDPGIVDVVHAAGISVVTTSAGDPALFTGRLHDAGMTVLHVVGSLRMARKAVDAGVDGLIVEGVEGGGFKSALGASTMVLLPLVSSELDVPIISAGGICDGRSMAAALVLGAHGVQMGTRMLASVESPVHAAFKQAILDADEMGTVLVSIPGRPTMRVIRTGVAEKAAAGGESPVGLDRVHELYFGGDMEASLANTGQVAGRIRDLRPVADIMGDMWRDCVAALSSAGDRVGPDL
jgi:enoyl-[acyl-carrier protein] reductase II